jgi:hypothetical protein
MAPKRKAPAAVVAGDGRLAVASGRPKVTAPAVTLSQMDFYFCERVEIYGRSGERLFYCAAHGCYHPVSFFKESELEVAARSRICMVKVSAKTNLMWPLVIDSGADRSRKDVIELEPTFYGKVELLERADMKIASSIARSSYRHLVPPPAPEDAAVFSMSDAGVVIVKGSLKVVPVLPSVMRLGCGNNLLGNDDTLFTRAVVEYVYQLEGTRTYQKAVCIAEAGKIFLSASDLSSSGVVVAFSCREVRTEHAQEFAPIVVQLRQRDDGQVTVASKVKYLSLAKVDFIRGVALDEQTMMNTDFYQNGGGQSFWSGKKHFEDKEVRCMRINVYFVATLIPHGPMAGSDVCDRAPQDDRDHN